MSRPTIAEIDLGAIASNLREVRRLVGPNVKICPAVKADAYGHGAIEVSRTVLAAGAHMLGVATIEEAVELRQAGISSPILLMQCALGAEIPQIVENDVTSTVYDRSFAEELARVAESNGKRAGIHIKIDTGMGRVGVQPEDAPDLVTALSSMQALNIEGILTHFPCADDPEHLCFTREQIQQFEQVVGRIEESGIRSLIRHAANSGAILSVPESHLDMVRPGIMLYGLYDSDSAPRDVGLRQSMNLKTRIVFLKELPPGRSVSYGRTFTTTRRTIVATIPVGYADGYSRALSNRGSALVDGKRVPIIGRVCMDQMMLDVTDIGDVAVGDEVVLYGSQGEEHISIEEIAALLDTISYEVVCALGKRVPRVYIRPSGP